MRSTGNLIIGLDREPDRAGCRGVCDVALDGREPINRRLELGPVEPRGQLVLCDPFPKQPPDRVSSAPLTMPALIAAPRARMPTALARAVLPSFR